MRPQGLRALVAVVGSSLSYFRYFFLIAVAAKMGTTYKLRPWVRMPFSAARRALTRSDGASSRAQIR